MRYFIKRHFRKRIIRAMHSRTSSLKETPKKHTRATEYRNQMQRHRIQNLPYIKLINNRGNHSRYSRLALNQTQTNLCHWNDSSETNNDKSTSLNGFRRNTAQYNYRVKLRNYAYIAKLQSRLCSMFRITWFPGYKLCVVSFLSREVVRFWIQRDKTKSKNVRDKWWAKTGWKKWLMM